MPGEKITHPIADAYVNHGRWLAKCPKCGASNPIKTGQKYFVCAGADCWASQYAMKQTIAPGSEKALQRLANGDMTAAAEVSFRRVPDLDARGAAIIAAREAGEEYEIQFRISPKKIEAYLRPRPVPNMNWLPHESLKDLERENDEHGIALVK